ncbi:MAG TPA: hypothetical protein VF507_03005 [Pyrinomonadaceae bacterium]|jgi:hypothetical protein
MRKQSLKIFLTFGLLAILAPLSAQAQSGNEQMAHIPFPFAVAGKTFPAGEYSVRRLNPSSDKAALAIRSADSRVSAVILTTPVQAGRTQESARLVFNRYGNLYYLAQVWAPADNTGLELPKSRSERALARNSREPAPERTAIALSTRRR